MSIEETATAAGLTRSWLSKVESFRITPSLPALGRLAEVLGTTVSDLVNGLDYKPGLVLTRAEDGKEVARDADISNIRYELLAHTRHHRKMDPMMLEIPAGGGRDKALAHAGEEFLIVFDGQTDFEYDGETYTLSKGDSLYFDASAGHRLLNPYDQPAQVLCIFYGLTGER